MLYFNVQAKDKLIDSLKSSPEGGGGGGERGLEVALDDIRSEKYQLQSQLINNEQVILSLRTELQVEREREREGGRGGEEVHMIIKRILLLSPIATCSYTVSYYYKLLGDRGYSFT